MSVPEAVVQVTETEKLKSSEAISTARDIINSLINTAVEQVTEKEKSKQLEVLIAELRRFRDYIIYVAHEPRILTPSLKLGLNAIRDDLLIVEGAISADLKEDAHELQDKVQALLHLVELQTQILSKPLDAIKAEAKSGATSPVAQVWSPQLPIRSSSATPPTPLHSPSVDGISSPSSFMSLCSPRASGELDQQLAFLMQQSAIHASRKETLETALEHSCSKLKNAFKELQTDILTFSNNFLPNNEVANKLANIQEVLISLINCVEKQSQIKMRGQTLLDEKIQASRLPFYLTDLMKDIESQFKPQLELRQLKITLVDFDDLILIEDEDKLTHVLRNLIRNAIKFTANTSTSVITIIATGEPVANSSKTNITLHVSDNGLGIAEADQKQIGEQFFQPNTSADSTGLGLTQCDAWALEMNGRCRLLRSQAGIGTTFEVIIQCNTVNLSLLQKTQNFLVIDDSALNTIMLTRQFKIRYPKCECVAAENGEIGFQIWRLAMDKNIKFAAILMDELMPVLDGIAATKKIRHAERVYDFPRTIIIGLTANITPTNHAAKVAEYQEIGMDQAAGKPYKFTPLFNTLDTLQEDAAAATPAVAGTAAYLAMQPG